MDYFPDVARANAALQRVMAGIIHAGGERCLTYLSRQDVSQLLRRFHIVSDRLESELVAQHYGCPLPQDIGSIVVAEKRGTS